MNALELLKALEESGTGGAKMEAARTVAREKETTLRAMTGAALVSEMRRRHVRRCDLMNMGGPRRERLEIPDEIAIAWPEGTIEKAERILAGMDPDPSRGGGGSNVFDVDEAVRDDVHLPGVDLDDALKRDDVRLPRPGVHPVPEADSLNRPGVRSDVHDVHEAAHKQDAPRVAPVPPMQTEQQKQQAQQQTAREKQQAARKPAVPATPPRQADLPEPPA